MTLLLALLRRSLSEVRRGAVRQIGGNVLRAARQIASEARRVRGIREPDPRSLHSRRSVLGELLLVHRPVPRPLPQTRRHPHRDPADDRHVRLGPAARRPPTTASTDPCGSIRTHQTFLGQLGRTRAAERDRLTGDYHRALPIIGEIDAANTAHDTEADP
jgi:hypothetical protein